MLGTMPTSAQSWFTSPATATTNIERATEGLAAAQRHAADADTRAEAAREALRLANGAKAATSAAAAAAHAALEEASASRRAAEESVRLATLADESASQSPDVWLPVEAARSVEAQAQVRAASADAAAAVAAGEAQVAHRRLVAADDAVRAATAGVRRAEDELRGARELAREVDTIEARRVGAQKRHDDALAAKAATFAKEAPAAVVPIVARYLAALGEIRAAEEELERALPPLAERGRVLAREFGFATTVPAELDLRAGAPTMLAMAARRLFGDEPWGRASSVKVNAVFARGDGSVFYKVITAALQLAKPGESSAAPLKRAG